MTGANGLPAVQVQLHNAQEAQLLLDRVSLSRDW